ncbi:MAG: Clp protease N-terminal domain-containing protein [Nocardioidaceae bacterium]
MSGSPRTPVLAPPAEQVARWRALQRFARKPHPGGEPDTGDLLLGLAETSQSVAARALSRLGVSVDDLQAEVERQRGRRRRAAPEQPVNPRARAAPRASRRAPGAPAPGAR